MEMAKDEKILGKVPELNMLTNVNVTMYRCIVFCLHFSSLTSTDLFLENHTLLDFQDISHL